MIYGIGTDICDVRRVRQSLERHGERFARRVLGDAEFAVWQRRSERLEDRGVRYVASRFSAKEAFSKAIGLGIHEPMQWGRCEILNQASGQPYIALHDALKVWCDTRGLRAHVTLSDESDYVVSFVVVEQDGSAIARLSPQALRNPGDS